MPGPVPKESSLRRRRNKSEIEVDVVSAGAPVVAAPEPDEDWDPRATAWFLSLAQSGQAVFYEASDWQTAKVAAHLLSVVYESGSKPSSMLVAEWGKLNTTLLGAEGDRRRLRMELARGPQIDEDEVNAAASVTDLRSRLGG